MLIDEIERRGDIGIKTVNVAPRSRVTEGRSAAARLRDGLVTTRRAISGLRALASEGHIDCAHVATSGSLSFLRDRCVLRFLHGRKIPCVYHVHFGRLPQVLAAGSWESLLFKGNAALAQKVVALDRSSYEAASAILPAGRVELVPNPMDMGAVRAAAGGLRRNKTVIFLGWVVPTKGVRELCDAWAALAPLHPDWSLEIVGPYDPLSVRELVPENLQNCRLVGEVEHGEALRRISAASVLSLPSYTEGLPTVIAEAMALGCPVVASSVGAVPEMLGDGRGLVVAPRDVDSLRRALDEAMSDDRLREDMAARAESYASEYYDAETVVGRYVSLWSECAAPKD